MIQGQQDGAMYKLSPGGFEQARKLGARLQSQEFHKVFCSDLGRCVQTMEALRQRSEFRSAPFYNDEMISFDAALREKSGGKYEGFPTSLYMEESKSANVPVRDYFPPGGERWKDVNFRVNHFLQAQVLERYLDPAIPNEQKSEFDRRLSQLQTLDFLIVTHSGVINELTNAFKSFSNPRHVDDFHVYPKNAAINVYRMSTLAEGASRRIDYTMPRVNNDAHLDKTVPELDAVYGKSAYRVVKTQPRLSHQSQSSAPKQPQSYQKPREPSYQQHYQPSYQQSRQPREPRQAYAPSYDQPDHGQYPPYQQQHHAQPPEYQQPQ